MAFTDVGDYWKSSKCLIKRRKKNEHESREVICWNCLMKSCDSMNVEECCMPTSLSGDLLPAMPYTYSPLQQTTLRLLPASTHNHNNVQNDLISHLMCIYAGNFSGGTLTIV